MFVVLIKKCNNKATFYFLVNMTVIIHLFIFYSTVTDFAKFLGLSGSKPFIFEVK